MIHLLRYQCQWGLLQEVCFRPRWFCCCLGPWVQHVGFLVVWLVFGGVLNSIVGAGLRYVRLILLVIVVLVVVAVVILMLLMIVVAVDLVL